MEKLKLDLDDLQVESFETEPEARAGSVLGYYGTQPKESTGHQIICDCTHGATDCDATCPGYANWHDTLCAWTCEHHCG